MPAGPTRPASRQLPPGCCAFHPPRPLQDVATLSELCKALGDATRLSILQLLSMAQRPLCVCELESQFELSQPTISHHLRILREAGLVRTSRKGTWVFYELRREALAPLRKLEFLFDIPNSAPSRAHDEHPVETEHE